MLIFAEGGKLENPEKTLKARERINNEVNSHGPRIEPGATVVRGERSQRNATHASLSFPYAGLRRNFFKFFINWRLLLLLLLLSCRASLVEA
jgi:hypothetical protein